MEAPSLNILLVEDDRVDVMNVRRSFVKNNISSRIWHATDGVEALEMLRAGSVPLERLLVLLDLNMPRMNGIELLREMRADPDLRHLPVVVMTTSDSDRDKLQAYDLNVAGYVVKPLTFSKFSRAMATVSQYWTLVELP